MSVEIFYAPIADVVTIPFDDLVIRLSEAGFTCKVEPETENMIWITFDNLDSSLLASVTAGQFVFGTLHASLTEEGASVVERVHAVMQGSGYSGSDGLEFE